MGFFAKSKKITSKVRGYDGKWLKMLSIGVKSHAFEVKIQVKISPNSRGKTQ